MICRPHRYEIGQKLLCFEPDNSKAKLIYFTKILKQIHNPNHSIPHYAVHFHGWKCKWDREVPEDLLLENNEFNRTLKRKIDEVARYVRGRYERKQRIDMILENAAVSGDDIDWDKVPGIWKGYSSKSSQYRSKTSPIKCTSMTDFGIFKDNLLDADDFFASKLDQDDITQFHFEQLQVHLPFTIPVQLPENLRTILQTHSTSSMSSKWNYWCSVLQLLQCYLDGFPYNGFTISGSLNRCSALGGVPSERVTRIMGPVYGQSDQSRLICAEICSSLRILFDFTLDSYLLQTHEKPASIKAMNQFQRNGFAFDLDSIDVPTEVESMYRFCSPRYELLPQVEAEKTPTLPCLNYSPHFLLRLIVILPDILEQMHLSSCRRAIVHRHLYLFLDYLNRTQNYWFRSTRPISVRHESASNKTFLRSTNHIPASESSENTEPLSNPELMRRETRQIPKHMQPLKIEPIDLPICLTASDSLLTLAHSTTNHNHHHYPTYQSQITDSSSSSISTKQNIRSRMCQVRQIPPPNKPQIRRSQRLSATLPTTGKNDSKSKSKFPTPSSAPKTRASSSVSTATPSAGLPKSLAQNPIKPNLRRCSLRSDSRK